MKHILSHFKWWDGLVALLVGVLFFSPARSFSMMLSDLTKGAGAPSDQAGVRIVTKLHPGVETAISIITILLAVLLGTYLWVRLRETFLTGVTIRPKNASTFFTLGKMDASTITHLIFWLGLAAAVLSFFLPLFPVLFLALQNFRWAFMGGAIVWQFLFFGVYLIVTAIFWKFTCEILLIVLKAFETYVQQHARPTEQSEAH